MRRLPRSPQLRAALGFALVALLVFSLSRLLPADGERSASAPPRAPEVSIAAPSSGPSAEAARTATAPSATRAVAAPGGDRAGVSAGTVVVRGKWGGGPTEFGRRPAQESNPEAPSAIAIDHGDVIILDQVNQRLTRFRAGQPIGSVALRETVQDFTLGPKGEVVALDRLADQNVQLYDRDGKPLGELPLAGKGLEETGHGTAIFADEGGVYVEREHQSLVRIGSMSGQPDTTRPELPGRLSRDGKRVVNAAIRDREAGLLQVAAFERATLENAWAVEVPVGKPILSIVMLETDRAGRTYVAVDTGREDANLAIVDASIVVLRLGFDGGVTGRIEVPSPSSGEEMLRPLTVDDEGAIYQLTPGSEGLSVVRHVFS